MLPNNLFEDEIVITDVTPVFNFDPHFLFYLLVFNYLPAIYVETAIVYSKYFYFCSLQCGRTKFSFAYYTQEQ